MIPNLIPKIWELTKNNKKQKVAKSLVKCSSLATLYKNKKGAETPKKWCRKPDLNRHEIALEGF